MCSTHNRFVSSPTELRDLFEKSCHISPSMDSTPSSPVVKSETANTSITRQSILPLFLSKADADIHAKCCNIIQADAYLDHARDFHAFSLTRLAWAMQHHANISTIERYLNGFDSAKVKLFLASTISVRMYQEAYPILFYAVEQNSPELVRVLCKAGADPGRKSEPTAIPLLAYTIISAEYSISDTTDTLLALLAEGAHPSQIPTDMFEAPLKAPKADGPKTTALGDLQSWCVPEVRKVLARNLTLMQRYSLWRAKYLAPSTPRMVQIASAFCILPLLEVPYHIIGQTPAIKQVIDGVASHYLFDSGFPLVMLFTGASGHGKTEVAKRMGSLLSLDIHIVDCTEMRYETDIFGPKAPYQGHERGSQLNNFLAAHDGQRAVVFMDEFEKTTKDVHRSLLLPFESGAFQDRRNGSKLDCSKIIWILAANVGEELIRNFWDNGKWDGRVDIDTESLSTELENLAITTFGAPLTGRLSYTIPFLPFTQLEQAITTYKFLREFKNEVRRSVDVAAKLFPRRLVLNYANDGQLAQWLAKKCYNHELGARSLQKAVHRHVKQKLAHRFLEEGTVVHDGLNGEAMAVYEVKVAQREGVGIKAAGIGALEVRVERRGVCDVRRALDA